MGFLFMEMHQIQYALVLAGLGGFSRAAKACHVSQPALTTAIKKLEDELGMPVFIRERTGVGLSEFGRVILPRFRNIVLQSEKVAEVAHNIKHLRRIPVRIGVLQTIGPVQMAKYLKLFKDEVPEAEVEFHTARHDELIRMLENVSMDLVMTHFVTPLPQWCVTKEVYQERYCVVLPPNHPLLSREHVALKDLEGEPYIDRLACEMRDRVADACKSQGVTLYPAYRSDRESWVESLVKSGVGFAIIPEFSIGYSQANARRCSDVALSRTVSAVRSGDRKATPVAKKLWGLLAR